MNDLLDRMTDPMVSASKFALATAIQAPNPQTEIVTEKTETLDDNCVNLTIAYNAFDLQDLEHHELEWRKGAKLKDYLAGLPKDAEWAIFLNGKEVDLKTAGNKKLSKLDHIGLILVPLGGGGTMKKIIMAVAAIGMIVAGILTGQTWLIMAGVGMGMSLVSSMLLMPKKPKSQGEDDSSYGIDGAKNTATENIPYPIIYGEFRTAGNFSDCYTENVGDDQYLYIRSIINDGEIEGAYDIEINEQPLSNFKLIQTRIHKGTLEQTVNDWFPSSITQYNKSMKLTTDFIQHNTTEEIDRVRFDLTFPGGLADIRKTKGGTENRTCEFEVQYRPKGQTVWQPLPVTSWSNVAPYTEQTDATTGDIIYVPATYSGVEAMMFSVDAPASQANQFPTEIRLANLTTGTEQTVGQMYASDDDVRGYVFDENATDGSIAGPTDITPMVNQTFEVEGLNPLHQYELRAYNGTTALSSGSSALQAMFNVSSVGVKFGSSGKFSITDKRLRAIRRSVASGTLPRDEYEFRIRRTTPIPDPVEDDDLIDEVWLTDVAEVNNTPVTLRGTANVSMRIKLNDQLNGIPQFTSRVKGSLCQTYDIEGNPLGKVWTNNPAWIGLDILIGEERGAGIKTSRIDFPRWVEFAEWCVQQNLTFNGVFSSISNMAEALQQVMRVGHGAPVPFGTKISVAIDRPREPVHVFTQGNILKDSFQISYLPVSDRANEYEFSYFDKTDRNKQKTLRYVDPKAVEFGDTPRAAQVSFPGVDNFEQARRELWKAIYQNRLLIRTISFDTWLDSINMTLGENALIQHDMMEWGNSGRLYDGCTTTKLVLDQKVTMTQSSNALVHFDAIQRASSSIASVVGKRVHITRPGGNNLTTIQLSAKRLVSGSRDYEIAKIENGTTYHTVYLADTPTGLSGGMPAELWDTDVVEERSVTSIADNANGTTTLTLSTPLPMAPPALSNFAFGPVVTVRKPYTLTGISGNGLEKRTLTFMEYHEGVYGPPEVEIPVPVTQVSDRAVRQVQALMMEYDSVVDPVRNTVNVRVYWNAANITNYGGADVYMGVNRGPLTPLGSAVNVNELHTTMNIGDDVIFKVVAYNKRGDRAPFQSAPMIGGTIDPELIGLPGPENFTATQTGFDASGTIQFTWVPPLDTTAITGYEINYRNEASPSWIGLAPVTEGPVEVTGQVLGDYEARIRSVGTNGGFSEWEGITYTVTHPDINAAPVGLQLNGSMPADQPYGEFTGKDAVFTWTDAVRDELYFLDYEVKIYDDLMVPLRTEYTVTPDYTYTFDKNTIDGAGIPRRAFNFEVRQRGRQGQLSAARAMFAQNPAPAFATPPTVEGAMEGIVVKCILPGDPDLEGIKIYGSLTDPVVMDDLHLMYQGTSSQVSLLPLEQGSAHFIRVVPFDAFGNGTPSEQYEVVPATLEDLFDTTPPPQVTGLALTSAMQFNDDNSVTPVLNATWSASLAEDFNRYEIEIKQDDGNFVGFQSGTNSFQWIGVQSGGVYSVRVRAVDHMGNKGVWSVTETHTVLADNVPPSVPGSFTAVATFRSAFLDWDNAPEADLKAVIVYENTTNDPATATAIATVAALAGKPGTYTRSGLSTNQTRYYWLTSVDTSGNESAKTVVKNITTAGVPVVELVGEITETQIANDAITTPKIAALAITANEIASDAVTTNKIMAGAVVTNHITVDTLLGDRIKAGTLEGASLSISTSLPPTITIGTTGVSIGSTADPAALVNAKTTLIQPGKISISGTTTLTSILYGGDNTKIDGGAIAANTITANKVTIGVRGINVEGIEFQHNSPALNRVSWTAGTIGYVDNAGALQSAAITASSTTTWAAGTFYVYWIIGETILRYTSSAATANGADRIMLATYAGGTNLVANYGRTIIDGSKIVTGSITATQLAATNIITQSAQIANGIIQNAHIQDASITTAKIGALQVTAAQIDNLTVGPEKIPVDGLSKSAYMVIATGGDMSPFPQNTWVTFDTASTTGGGGYTGGGGSGGGGGGTAIP